MTACSDRLLISTRGENMVACLDNRSLWDASTVRRIQVHLRRLIVTRPDHIRSIQLDFRKVSRMATAVLNRLIRFHYQALDEGLSVHIINLQPAVREIFEVTRLDRTFQIETNSISTA